jgi:putative hydrolase of the HAD superfamily
VHRAGHLLHHANAPAAWFFPLIVGSTVGLLILFLAGLTQACFNPARDFGPRLVLVVMGFGSEAIPGPREGAAMAVTIVGPLIGGLLGAFFHDKVMRPLIPGVEPEPAITSPGQLAREPVQHLETTTSLLGHAPAMPADPAGGAGSAGEGIELVILDVGGTIYDDDCYAQALLKATRELAGAAFDEPAFWRAYDEQRQAQSGSLRRAVADRFLAGERKRLNELAQHHLEYPASALYADVRPTLEALASRYKLGVVTNQHDQVLPALRRDGLADLFTVIATADSAGVEKPDLGIWRWALDQAEVSADRVVHVGNRLDADVRPAHRLGMRAVWLLRGDVPPSPTVEQLSEPDAVVTSFSGVPSALAGMAQQRHVAAVR